MICEKRISVIVPVYNVENYLSKCIETLTAQTYSNIEILLVDDGSTDSSGQICDEYAVKDNRIMVIHKENGGLSSARNAGMPKASGEYIAFVDSDDFVSEDYIESLLEACENNGAKVAACGYIEYYSPEKQIVCCGEKPYTLTGEDAVKDIFTMKNDIHVVAWNKLYARELFVQNEITYPEGKIHEDVFTTYKLCARASTVAYVNKPCYYYVQRKGSIMGQNFSPKRLQLLEAVESVEPFVKENSPVYDTEYLFYVFLNYLTIINAMADSRYYDKVLFKNMVTLINSVMPEMKKNKYFGKKHKLTVLFLKFGMRGYYFIRKLYKRIG